jgi:dihydroorotate dehydrogenase
LFRFDPEVVHAWMLGLLRLAESLPPARALLRLWFGAPERPVKAFGLTFPNPVGIAAGYDKDGLGWRGLACLGFGHIEIGTVTPHPQPGNPQPRLFRLREDRALINRMGFPGRGAEFVARQLQGRRPPGLVLGVNLGKNKDTPLEKAVLDYLSLYQTFAPLADYLVVNVSSPNTIGLRRLQAREALHDLLAALAERRKRSQTRLGRRVPILVKLAPDLTSEELDDALRAIHDNGMDGVIAANTTLSREGLRSPLGAEGGGLSGEPLRQMSTRMIREIFVRTRGNLPIIGVGGISSAAHAREKLEAGAALVQVYTGLVYEGPGLVKRIMRMN